MQASHYRADNNSRPTAWEGRSTEVLKPFMNHVAFEVPDLSLVRVAGADAIKVLNGLCTAKLVELPAGKAAEAMFTDDRGRVLTHGMVVLEPKLPVAWIIGQYPEPAKLSAHIDRFIFREDAQPKDVTSQWSGMLIDSCSTSGGWAAVSNQLSIATDSTARRSPFKVTMVG